MSFAVSMDDGRFEYSGSGLSGLFGQPGNLFRPRFWKMLVDLVRFYQTAPRDLASMDDGDLSLGEYLEIGRYGDAFRERHILPMAGAIWSSTPAEMLSYPAASFVRFYHNHGLLKLHRRPPWETVRGGSRTYVERLTRSFADQIRLDTAVVSVRRTDEWAYRHGLDGALGTVRPRRHGCACRPGAVACLPMQTQSERELLGAFRYSRNLTVLHRDQSFMPKRRAVWSSWNYLGSDNAVRDGIGVTYWMNRLQNLATEVPVFVTLNPRRSPRAGSIIHSEVYEHPIFDARAIAAQQRLWLLQGKRKTWFCGAHFGAGFHEDGLQAGLAVAEQLGGLRRPWSVANKSGRIVLTAQTAAYARELQT